MNELCQQICPYSKLQRGAMCGACTLGSAFDVVEDEVPAADVRENVRGKWVYNEMHNNFFCSICHCDRYGRSNEDGTVSFNNFCPNCNADMR